eukprot:289042_1
METQLQQFAFKDSISRRPGHRLRHLKLGDYLDIKPCSTIGWVPGQIISIPFQHHLGTSGGIKVAFERKDGLHSFVWVRLDNESECDALAVHTDTPFCIYCERGVIFNQRFISSNCKSDHFYHIKCAAKMINESLSVSNEIPKCLMANCNKSFNISLSKPINKKLSKQYQINPE